MVLRKDLLSWEPVQMLVSKSSSSTSTEIASIELSMVDMLYDYYNSVLLFFDVGEARPLQGPPAPAELVSRLKHALEELLVHYPCAAGLLVYNETADCLEVTYPVCGYTHSSCNISHPVGNMYGVHFHVAHANVALADLGDVSNPQPSLDLLYPTNPTQLLDSKGHPIQRFVMAFQVTTFKCGGFTLGHTCSHVYADGYTAAAFLQNLCSITRGAGLANTLQTTPSRRALISAREPPSPTMPHPCIVTRKQTGNLEAGRLHYGTATRFRFSMETLEALRASVSTPGQLKVCSRNQALVALLWTSCARVRLNVHGLPGSYELALRVPMNMRTRGFSTGYMGNATYQLSVPATLQELCENDLTFVVDKISRTVESLNLGEGLQSMVDYVEVQRREGQRSSIGGLSMPSLVGLPFYDTDCGWGVPKYVGRPSQQLSNRCIILDHPAAGAWNVLVVFASSEEHACFRESIADWE